MTNNTQSETLKAGENTDRELWREREGDYYANSIHVTEHGGIGISVGGNVIVKPLADWHALATRTPSVPSELVERIAAIIAPEAKRAWDELVVDYGQRDMGWSEADAVAYAEKAHRNYRPESNWPLAKERAQAALASLTATPDKEVEILERAVDRMGWPEIHAFQAECRKGQDVYEDAGGYLIRCIKALFGLKPRDPVLTYQDAARAMVRTAFAKESK